MRAYFFTNTWLSGLQKGLQVAHCAAEMTSASFEEKTKSILSEWVWKHKTILILDGGSHADLLNIKSLFENKENLYPWASFSEDLESLNGAMTAVGIILPEKIYDTAKKIREEKYMNAYVQNVLNEFSPWERSIISLINSCSLAR